MSRPMEIWLPRLTQLGPGRGALMSTCCGYLPRWTSLTGMVHILPLPACEIMHQQSPCQVSFLQHVSAAQWLKESTGQVHCTCAP